MVVLWNVVYLDTIVKHLRQQGCPVRDEYLARLWVHVVTGTHSARRAITSFQARCACCGW